MIKRKSLCLIGLTAALLLSGCGSSTEGEQGLVSHGENIEDGNVSIIVDSSEGEKAELTMPPEAARVKLTIGIVKNDVATITLANLANENENDSAFEKYEFVYANNYTELSQMLKDNQIGVAFMPPTKALDMYAADKSVKVLASVTGKSYRLVGDDIASLSDLSGKTVYISQDDKISLCIMTRLLNYAGVKDCSIEYVKDNTALYEAVKSGQAAYALMTEPYISMLKQAGIPIGLYDITADWETTTGNHSYSSGCVVATNEFISTQKAVLDYMLADIERSVNAALSDSDTSAENAVKHGLADNEEAVAGAYASMDMNFFKDKQMRFLISNMLMDFENTDSEALGTDVPDKEFYFVKE